jgi:AraC family transcriptional regulator
MSGRLDRIIGWEQLAKVADYQPCKLAALCGVSERQLQRFFRERRGKPPSDWLRELQCDIAKHLISQGYSTKAAAAESGFASSAHFCREFKKHFGTSPQTYAPVPSAA